MDEERKLARESCTHSPFFWKETQKRIETEYGVVVLTECHCRVCGRRLSENEREWIRMRDFVRRTNPFK